MSDELRDAARALDDAITREGVEPAYHRAQVARLRAEWPTLWVAIERVRAAAN
ncbi:Uncharacterised protein [Tsukamurella paurometabola]|uniref:Uncharacterized protein n=1 Tax=Tsukamurella paurometabola TaxID=2061 RepID=A0A3P8MEH0_TSUPA|nr:Uncharacterised protein [Tsukamurella paurometabola]